MTTVFQSVPVALMVLSPRTTRVGEPSSSVDGINTIPIADGALTFCQENGETYRLEKDDNSTPPDGNTVIAPLTGPGRWFIYSGGPPTGPAGGDLGSTYPNPTVVAIEETSTPARLAVGAVQDGELLQRVGTTLVGIPIATVGDHKARVDGTDTVADFLIPKLGAGSNISFTVVDLGGGDKQLVIAAVVPPGSSDHKVLVDGGDTTAAFLGAKLAAGSHVILSILNPGGNEQVQISVASAPPSGAAGGDLSGVYPTPTVVAIEETSSPQRLAIAGIPDGTFLKRSGATVIGVASAPPSGAAGGDLASTYPNPTVVAIEETSTPARLAIAAIPDGTILKRSGATVVGVAATFPPSGAAGGDLGSTYPNPTVVAIEETSSPQRLAIAGIPDGTLLSRSGATVAGVAKTAVGDHKVLVDGADTTAAFLVSKLAAGANVTLTVLGPGNEQIQISVSSAPPSGAAGGDLGSTYPNPTVVAIEETSSPQRLAIAGIPDGTFLKRSGTTVVGASSAPPSGAAGGDLGSTYPNPTVVAIEETSSPQRLAIAGIPDGTILKRSGATVVGVPPGVLAVRLATVTTLPSYTYANGSLGVSATITYDAVGAPAGIDGKAPALGDTMLLANGQALSDNGVYVMTTLGDGGTRTVWTRSTLADTPAKLAGLEVIVEDGDFNKGSIFVLPETLAGITIGTTGLVFVQVGPYTGARTHVYFREDWAFGVNGAAVSTTNPFGPGGFLASNSGTAGSTYTGANNTAREIGIVTMSATTATSFALLFNNGSGIVWDHDAAVFISAKIRIPTISDGTNTFSDRIGTIAGGSVPTDGVYVQVDSNADPHFELVTRQGGSGAGNATVTPGTTTAIANQWYHLLLWKSAGSDVVHAAIDSVEIGVGQSTHVPTGTVTSPEINHVRSASNGAARTMDVDWYELRYYFPLGRAG